MGLDGNNGQYPLAYGVAHQEDEEEWSFFLHGLATALDAREDSSKYTIMSDRHKVQVKLTIFWVLVFFLFVNLTYLICCF